MTKGVKWMYASKVNLMVSLAKEEGPSHPFPLGQKETDWNPCAIYAEVGPKVLRCLHTVCRVGRYRVNGGRAWE